MVIDGILHAKVKVDDCMWQLQDSHKLIITLQKLIGLNLPLLYMHLQQKVASISQFEVLGAVP